jgi:hypothetical protein
VPTVKSALKELQTDPAGTLWRLPMGALFRRKVNSPSPSVNVPTVGMVSDPPGAAADAEMRYSPAAVNDTICRRESRVA